MRYFFVLIWCSFLFGQQKNVDFKSINSKLSVDFITKNVSGFITIKFLMLKNVDSIYLDAKSMEFSQVILNKKSTKFKVTKKHFIIYDNFQIGQNTLTLLYEAKPKQTMYFIGESPDFQIWTQGQGKDTSHWLPSIDDVNDKIVFGLEIKFDKNYTVLSNGILKKSLEVGNQKTWQYQMQKPMSSYLVMLAIGKFAKQSERSNSGIVLEKYLHQDDISKFDATYQHNKQIFDFLETEIGFDYPWEIYRQVAAKDFLYGGMENTSATIFSQDYVVDDVGFIDKNYVNVNAHELAHQWFGDLVTAKSGKHHWLQEGFATYYALLAEQNIFGDDYFDYKLYEMAERLQRASQKDTIPILNEKASSLTFYQKGAWALHAMRTEIGVKNFKNIVQKYLKKHQFQNVETADFLKIVADNSDFDVKLFQKNWLENPKFDVQTALNILGKSKMMQQYFEIAELKNIDFKKKRQKFEMILKSNVFFAIKQEVIYQIKDVAFDDKKQLLDIVFESKDIQLRQAIAETITVFADDYQSKFESLLDDDSYITKEITLNVLWNKYPKNQIFYLEKSKNWIGFNDKNLKILWLNLALRTKDFVLQDKSVLYDELLNYSSSKFEIETRQNAIKTLFFLDKNDQNVLPNLVNGLTNHRWQMVKFSKDNIRRMQKTKSFREYFEKLLPNLNQAEANQLSKLLAEK